MSGMNGMSKDEIAQILHAVQQAIKMQEEKKDEEKVTQKKQDNEDGKDQHNGDKKDEKQTQSGNNDPVSKDDKKDDENDEDQHINDKNQETINMISDATDVMELFNRQRDREESKEKRVFVCQKCYIKKEEINGKWAFQTFNGLLVHSEKASEYCVKDIDKDLYYHCTAMNCTEVFRSYEDQLDHHLNHAELYCCFCCKFTMSRLQTFEHQLKCSHNVDRIQEVVIDEAEEKQKRKQKKSVCFKAEASYFKAGTICFFG